MKTYNKVSILFTFLLVLGLTSCDDKFLEFQQNPNNPENATIDVVLTSAQLSQLNDFGGANLGYVGVFTQHFAGNHATGVNYDQYTLTNGDFSWLFSGLYLGALNDYRYIIEQGTADGNYAYVGIAKVLTAFGLGTMTSVYGDLPWSEAFDPNISNPKYDTQEEIYGTIMTMLGQAVADLDKDSPLKPGSDDVIYKGNISKWKALAHLLMARYENHLSKKDPAGSATRALAHVNAAKAEGFTSRSANFAMPYEGTAQHRNNWYNLWENNLIIASEGMVDQMVNALTINYGGEDKVLPDPRLEGYWDNTRFPDEDTLKVNGEFFGYFGYSGKPNGFGVTNLSYSPVGPHGFFGQKNSKQPLATYQELLFIEAEAALRSGDPTRAAAAYNEAIAESIDEVVPSIESEYMNFGNYHTDAAANSAIITAHLDTLQDRVAAYKADYGSETAATISEEKIMTEKWTAMFTMEVETWVDMRRHNFAYPAWVDIPMNTSASDFIRRFPVPQTELDQNSSMVPDVNATIFDKLWFEQ